jgi:hypothetical protein
MPNTRTDRVTLYARLMVDNTIIVESREDVTVNGSPPT